MSVLNVPLFAQRDNAWKNDKVGSSSNTLGQIGCLIASSAMLCAFYKKDTDPKRFNIDCTDKKLYSQDSNKNIDVLANDAISVLYPDITYDKRVDCVYTPAPLGDIDIYLAAGKPVIVGISFDPANVGNITGPNHFLLIIGKNDDGSYAIRDPWYAEDPQSFDKYYTTPAKDILEVLFYSGPKVAQPIMVSVEDSEFRELVTKSSKYDTFSAAGYNSIDDVNKKVKDTADALSQTQIENTQLKQQALELNAQIKSMNTAMESIKQEDIDAGQKELQAEKDRDVAIGFVSQIAQALSVQYNKPDDFSNVLEALSILKNDDTVVNEKLKTLQESKPSLPSLPWYQFILDIFNKKK
jgi:hypothetical protein